MNRDELLQILQEETDGFTEQSRLRDDVLDTLEKVQELAINYTRCCTELKDKETISFEEWLFVNNYKKLFDYFVKDAVSFTESELMQIYNDQVMNL
tara:strand:- start:24 stop:311 length:288 start_codon:yes stop_codon:yes gene_type:complete